MDLTCFCDTCQGFAQVQIPWGAEDEFSIAWDAVPGGGVEIRPSTRNAGLQPYIGSVLTKMGDVDVINTIATADFKFLPGTVEVKVHAPSAIGAPDPAQPQEEPVSAFVQSAMTPHKNLYGMIELDIPWQNEEDFVLHWWPSPDGGLEIISGTTNPALLPHIGKVITKIGGVDITDRFPKGGFPRGTVAVTLYSRNIPSPADDVAETRSSSCFSGCCWPRKRREEPLSAQAAAEKQYLLALWKFEQATLVTHGEEDFWNDLQTDLKDVFGDDHYDLLRDYRFSYPDADLEEQAKTFKGDVAAAFKKSQYRQKKQYQPALNKYKKSGPDPAVSSSLKTVIKASKERPAELPPFVVPLTYQGCLWTLSRIKAGQAADAAMVAQAKGAVVGAALDLATTKLVKRVGKTRWF